MKNPVRNNGMGELCIWVFWQPVLLTILLIGTSCTSSENIPTDYLPNQQLVSSQVNAVPSSEIPVSQALGIDAETRGVDSNDNRGVENEPPEIPSPPTKEPIQQDAFSAQTDQRAMDLLAQGKYLQAIKAFQDVIDRQNKELDDIQLINRDRNTSVDVSKQFFLIRSSRIGQMMVYEELGDLRSAEDSCLNLLESMERKLGPRHPLTLDALLRYAHIRERQGGWTDAHLAYRWCAEMGYQYDGDGKALQVAASTHLGELYARAGQSEKALGALTMAADTARELGGHSWVLAEGALARHSVELDASTLPEVMTRLNQVATHLAETPSSKSLQLQLGLDATRTYYLAAAYSQAVSHAENTAAIYGNKIASEDCVAHGQLMLVWAKSLVMNGAYAKAEDRYSQASEILSAFVSPVHPVRAEMHSTLARIYLERSKRETENATWLLQAGDQLCHWVSQRWADLPDTTLPPWYEMHLRTHYEIAQALNNEELVGQLSGQLEMQTKTRASLAKILDTDQRRYRFANLDSIREKAKSEVAAQANDRRQNMAFSVTFTAPNNELSAYRAKKAMIDLQMRNAKYFNPHTMGDQGFYQYQRSLGN